MGSNPTVITRDAWRPRSARPCFFGTFGSFSAVFLYTKNAPPRCLAGLRHPARARASGKPAPVASISTASHHHYVLASLACCVGAPAEPTANRRSSTFAASCMSISNPPSVQSGGVAAWHGISERVQSDGARAARPRLARLSARLRLWASVLQPARSPGSRCHGLRRRFLRLSAARLSAAQNGGRIRVVHQPPPGAAAMSDDGDEHAILATATTAMTAVTSTEPSGSPA